MFKDKCFLRFYILKETIKIATEIIQYARGK